MKSTHTKTGEKNNVLKISWCPSDENKLGHKLQWIQPSVAESDDYITALNKAYDLLFRLDTILTSQGSIRDQLNEFQGEEATSNREVSKMEKQMATLPPLSLRLLGPLALSKTLIPGACPIGQKGLWYSVKDSSSSNNCFSPRFKADSSLDLTQAVVYFNRDYSKKGFPSIKVTSVLAYENPILAPTFHAWDPTQLTATINEGEPLSGNIPNEMAKGDRISKDFLNSIIDRWSPPPIIIYAQPSTFTHKKWDLENFVANNGRSDGVFQANGFRLQCQAHETKYDSKIQSQVYGITEKAATPNQTGVNSRSRWFSKEYCTYLLSKERGSDDFFHLLQNKYTDKDGGSSNEPLLTTIFLTAYSTKCIKGIKMDIYLGEQRKRKHKQELEKKRRDLNEKISAADKILAKRLHDEIGLEENEFYSSTEHDDIDIKEQGLLENDNETSHLDSISEYGTVNESKADTVEHSSSTKNNIHDISASNDSSNNLRGYGWRKLPKSMLGVDFFELNKHKIQTCVKGDLFDRCNTVRSIGRVNASQSINYNIDDNIALFQTKTEVKFVKDVLLDRIEVSHAIEEQKVGRDKILSSNQQEALDYILNVPMVKSSNKSTYNTEEQQQRYQQDESTRNSNGNNNNNNNNDSTNNNNNLEEALLFHQENKEKSIIEKSNFMKQKKSRDDEDMEILLAVKHSNYDKVKEIIDDGNTQLEVDTYDEFGNTLFIIACQQGNKKMCKFLLRRGAYINAQNHAGNTGLHYLYEYGHVGLAEYLVQKGADDTYLNADGLTCFEGVSRNNLDAL